MPSFDVVSEINNHEVANAVDQANREIQQRFDFRDSGAVFELAETTITMRAKAEFQLKQMLDILRVRLSKRGIDPMCVDAKDANINLGSSTQEVTLKHGIDQDSGRVLTKLIKESKLKVQAAIQGDKVRVTGKSRDDLQEAMGLMRKAKLDVPLQFNNFKD